MKKFIEFKEKEEEEKVRNLIRKAVPSVKEGFQMIDSLSGSEFLSFFVSIEPSIKADGKPTLFCLLCLFIEQKIRILKGGKSGNLQSHLKYCHAGCLEENEVHIYKQIIDDNLVDKKFNIKKGLQTKAKKEKSQEKKLNTLSNYVMDFNSLKYRLAYWLLCKGRPLYLVNDTEFRNILTFINSSCPTIDRTTVYRAMRVVHGFHFERIISRLHASAAYFRHKSFLVIQADVWTSQQNQSVYGISGSYYDIETKRVETIVFYCAPLLRGKKGEDLENILNAVLKLYGIKSEWVMQCVTDAEGSVSNSMSFAFPAAVHTICLAHRLQTCLRHSFALGSVDYEKDSFPEAFEWWSRIRSFVKYFTQSAQRTRRLKELQLKDKNNEDTNHGKGLGMVKFSATHWCGAYYVLQRMLRIRKYLDEYFIQSKDPKKLSLNNRDWLVVLEVCSMLSPFEEVTRFVQFKYRSIGACEYAFLEHLDSMIQELERGLPLTFSDGGLVKYTIAIEEKLPRQMLTMLRRNFDLHFRFWKLLEEPEWH